MQVNDYQLNQLQEKDKLLDKHNNELNEVQQRFKASKERNIDVLKENRNLKQELRKQVKTNKLVKETLNNLNYTQTKLLKEKYTQRQIIKTKDDLINSLKEAAGIEPEDDSNNDEITNNKINEENTANKNDTNEADKQNSNDENITEKGADDENRCDKCNDKYRNHYQLEEHYEKEHTVKKCPMCKSSFDNDVFSKHVDKCYNSILEKYKCEGCGQKILKIHKNQHKTECVSIEGECDVCGLIVKNKDDIEDHKMKEHDEYEGVNRTWEGKKKIECRFFYKGRCFRGDRCNFIHTYSKPYHNECRYGQNCRFFIEGRCRFFHSQTYPHRERRNDYRSSEYNKKYISENHSQGQENNQCWFDTNCQRRYCRFKHSRRDFQDRWRSQNFN